MGGTWEILNGSSPPKLTTSGLVVPIDDLWTQKRWEIVKKTRNGGPEIVNLLGNGSSILCTCKINNCYGRCNLKRYKSDTPHVQWC